ncbi:uncharacterized protein C1orf87 homolog isoform X2 [Hyperolius riggenbachi]|uniref:uncharacterized protein C1orf87 homolog isoform X2 n=1 Tax=Hyperolius riggenbachi TaxID=752182 RepID=UPI0035A3D271
MSDHTSPPRAREKIPETIVKIIASKYVRYPVHKYEGCPNGDRVKGNARLYIKELMSGIQNIDSFRGSLLRRDRHSCSLLSISEFVSVCESHGVSIPPASMLPLLEDNAFADQGKLRWRNIADVLRENEHRKSSLNRDRAEDHLLRDDETKSPPCLDTSERPTSEHLPAPTTNLTPPQTSRPVSEPALHLFEEGDSEERGAWIDRFKKMENVLRMCQIKDTGLVEAERANQIIHKYNLIYGLSLSEEKMAEALGKFCAGDHMTLEPLLIFLKEL